MSGLRLAAVTRDNVRAACGLETRPEQQGTVAPVAWSLAAAYTIPEIAWPRLVYDGDRLAGFIMGAFDPDGGVELFRSFLWRMNIGAGHQAGATAGSRWRGCARRRCAVASTGSWCPGSSTSMARTASTCVWGSAPTGERNQGEVVAERILAPGT